MELDREGEMLERVGMGVNNGDIESFGDEVEFREFMGLEFVLIEVLSSELGRVEVRIGMLLRIR